MSNITEEKKTSHEERKPTTIEVVEPTIFEGDLKTKLLTNTEAAEIVSSLFGSAFTDYCGCNVRVKTPGGGPNVRPVIDFTVPNGAIYVDLFFQYKNVNNGKIKNLQLLNASTGKDGGTNNMAAKYFMINNLANTNANGCAYHVTRDTFEALSEFMYGATINWKEHVSEESINTSALGSKENAIVRISGLSLDKILTKIYGGDPTGKDREYDFEYTASVAGVIPNNPNGFVMQVTQLSRAAVRKLGRSMGIGVVNNTYCPYNG